MQRMTSRKPNLLFVFSDQQRASAIGCSHGDEDLVTPSVDALAGEGLRIEAAVSDSPVCTPYRVMLMNGLVRTSHGDYERLLPGFESSPAYRAYVWGCGLSMWIHRQVTCGGEGPP